MVTILEIHNWVRSVTDVKPTPLQRVTFSISLSISLTMISLIDATFVPL
jgi:hypothetical protein